MFHISCVFVIMVTLTSSVYAEPCQRVLVGNSKLQAECCIIKQSPNLVRISLEPPAPIGNFHHHPEPPAPIENFHHNSRPEPPIENFQNSRPLMRLKRHNKGERHNEPNNCKSIQVNVQEVQGECCVTSGETTINTLRELNELLASGRFEPAVNMRDKNKSPKEPAMDNSSSITFPNKNLHQGPSDVINVTTEPSNNASNIYQSNNTLTLKEVLFMPITTNSPLSNKVDKAGIIDNNNSINNKTLDSSDNKVTPQVTPVPYDNSTFVFPTEQPAVPELPNRNAVDAPKVCPQGQARDTSGQCGVLFD